MMNNGNLIHWQTAMLSAISNADNIVLFAHISPDGDTLGSTLAMRGLLLHMGKNVAVVVDGEVPEWLACLPHSDCFLLPSDPSLQTPYDLAISVDVSCEERLGASKALYDLGKVRAVLDHHATNEGFGDLCYIDGKAPATAVLVARLFEEANIDIDTDDAICLYVALSTDTGNFIYESTNAECFELMAKLMRAKLPLAEYSRILFREKQADSVRVLGVALPSLYVGEEGAVSGIRISRAQLESVGADDANTEGLVDYAIDIKGVKLAYFIRETKEGFVKGSLRALPPYRVDEVAGLFGGGGHRLASGCTIKTSLAEAEALLQSALGKAYRGEPL